MVGIFQGLGLEGIHPRILWTLLGPGEFWHALRNAGAQGGAGASP